jgi:hypothetical protein
MSGWLDDFPVRPRDYELEAAVDAQAELADDLEGDELRVARRLLGEWATESGGLTAKLREVEGMTRAEKRWEVAAAYHALGLETPEERLERESYTPIIREYPPLPTCHVCGDFPRDNMGHPDPNFARVKRWHCKAHEHLAEPGDMDPAPPPQFDPSIPFTDGEIERMRREDERLAKARAARNEERLVRIREQQEVRRVEAERFEREVTGGYGFNGRG